MLGPQVRPLGRDAIRQLGGQYRHGGATFRVGEERGEETCSLGPLLPDTTGRVICRMLSLGLGAKEEGAHGPLHVAFRGTHQKGTPLDRRDLREGGGCSCLATLLDRRGRRVPAAWKSIRVGPASNAPSSAGWKLR